MQPLIGSIGLLVRPPLDFVYRNLAAESVFTDPVWLSQSHTDHNLEI